MYKELEKFKSSNQFSITVDESLEEKCNASDGSGVFLVYDVADKKEYNCSLGQALVVLPKLYAL